MFGLGLPEIIFIVITAIVILGPERMPRVAKKLGKLLAKMRSAATSLGDAIAQDESLSELKSDVVQANRAVHDLKSSVSPFASSIPKTVSDALDEVKHELKDKDASPTPSNPADAPAPQKSTPAPSDAVSAPAPSPTQKLFEHIEKHLNKHSHERAVFIEKPILVSTQIARATSRFSKPLNAPKEPTATICAILLDAPRPDRAVEQIRSLAPARVSPTQRVLPLAAPSASTGLSHIPLKRGSA